MMGLRTQAWLDQEDAHIAAMIRRHGWVIQYIGDALCSAPDCSGDHDDGPPFAYTVGLFGLNHPELLIFSVSQQTAAGVLNTLGDRIRSGEELLPGHIVTFDEWPNRISPEWLLNPGEILFEANRYYRRPDEDSVPALQLSYDDDAGRFPWEPGHAGPEMQPRPGTFRA